VKNCFSIKSAVINEFDAIGKRLIYREVSFKRGCSKTALLARYAIPGGKWEPALSEAEWSIAATQLDA
jgi:hypothetical protein